MGKRLKTGEKPNEYKVVKDDEDLFTELEKELGSGKGRFLLEKKSKFQLQSDSRVVSCDISSGSNDQAILVLGQSNGVFGIYNLDTLKSIHSFQISTNKIDSVAVNL